MDLAGLGGAAALILMRILFVAMPDSVHAARWINQLAGVEGWDVHLFPAYKAQLHPGFGDVTVHWPGAGPSVVLGPFAISSGVNP